MGIINITPDSFSDGGQFPTRTAAVESALAMLDEGAAIVDLGAESTRPGSHETVTAAEEIDRLLPVVEGVLRGRSDAILSVDTYRAETAEAAVRAGAEIVNDVSGLLWDEEMAEVCAVAQCGLVLTHTRGRPHEWKSLPKIAPADLMPLVERELRRQMEVAAGAGIEPERIVVDPGFGFGKALGRNYALLAELGGLRRLGRPVLAGVSRKSFLGRTLAPLFGGQDAPVAAREHASLAAATAAILAGADIVRTHNVRPMLEAAAIADAVLAAAGSPDG